MFMMSFDTSTPLDTFIAAPSQLASRRLRLSPDQRREELGVAN